METDTRPAAPRFVDDSEPLARGAAIGRYMVLGLVGRGGMGDVYEAHDPKLARKVAVKLVRGGGGDSASRMRLLREAQAIAKLSHPNVVVVHDVGTYKENVFIAMELVEGPTVSAWLKEAPRSTREVLAIYTAAGRGLAAAHQVGMVHRDFKPDNVMVGRDGQVRVMDFGLARQAEAEESDRLPEATAPASDAPPRTTASRLLDGKLTRTGTMVGTPAYMAPEQFLTQPTDARTDQFSFCVALYEGLYGHRPFAGDTIVGLTSNVLDGNVVRPPADSKVPAHVRRILLRGLATSPAARWPSMTALLDALAHDPTRTDRRRLAFVAGGLAAAMMLAAGAAAWRGWRERPQLCRGAADKLAGIWEPDAANNRRKADVRRAFLRTGAAYAASSLASVEQRLDRYATAWKKMYEDACQATHVRGDQSAQALDLRMACLQDRLGRLRALVEVFGEANATVVQNALGAADALPALESCADAGALHAVTAPPQDQATRTQVEILRRDLARVEAVGNSGQCANSVEAGRKLVDQARAVGYLPLEAEALNALARSGGNCLDPTETVQLYKEALRAAVASRYDEAAVAAALLMSQVMADRLHDVRGARDWLELGRAVLRPIATSHPLLDAWALSAEGLVYRREGQLRAALQQFQQALALQEKTLGPDHLEVALTLNDVGAALRDINRIEDSITHFDRARRLGVQLLGPDHPQVALYLANRGEALNAMRLYREGLADNQRALEIWKAAGASAFYVAHGLTRVAESLLGLGRLHEAVTDLEEAMRLHQQNRTPFFPATRFALARALWPAQGQRTRAVVLAEEAKADYERAGADPSQVGDVDTWLRQHQLP